MSLLAPLYALAALAVSLPVLFHLIRRTPRGRLAFSSLMFLSPSPPRLTRKSRLNHLLLLILRGLVLVLLALAFTRPFLREATPLGVEDTAGRSVAILVDTSASMRRTGLWQQAMKHAGRWLDDLGPRDNVALFAFDSESSVLVPFSTTAPTDTKEHVVQVRAHLEGLGPTWAGSDLGNALITAADVLHDLGGQENHELEMARQIVLISDLGEGSRIEPLQSYVWPEDVRIAVEQVKSQDPNNAGLHSAPEVADADETTARDGTRVRVTNERDCAVESFQLRWLDEEGLPVDDDPTAVYVPPGESRVVRVPSPEGSRAGSRLILQGDAHDFDNVLHLAPVRQEVIPLIYVGNDDPDDPKGLRYYLQRALPDTRRTVVSLAARAPEALLAEGDLAAARFVVVGDMPAGPVVGQLVEFMDRGGTVLLVLKDASAGERLAQFTGLETTQTEEAQANGYAMLGTIAFGHPIFATFSDPRFNDFTKIHFWKYRRVALDDRAGLKVLARFDSGDPALLEQTRGKGKLLVLTSGWHPADSQLARSTKFVPLLSRILESSGAHGVLLSQHQVGDAVALPGYDRDSSARTICKPDGSITKLAADASVFDDTDQPGVYSLVAGTNRVPFAVNVPAAESNTSPIDVGRLEQFGVRLGKDMTRAEIVERQRQMRDVELEKRQKLWRWLIAAALGVLILETWLAGRLGRRAQFSTG